MDMFHASLIGRIRLFTETLRKEFIHQIGEVIQPLK